MEPAAEVPADLASDVAADSAGQVVPVADPSTEVEPDRSRQVARDPSTQVAPDAASEGTPHPGAEPAVDPVVQGRAGTSVTLVQRIAVVVAGAAALVAAYLWFAPITVPASQGLPFGCGSPAHPNDQQLGGVVCGAGLGAARALAGVAFAVAVVAVVVVLLLRPLGHRPRSAPIALGVLLAAPLLGAAVLRLLTTAEIRSSDGSVVLDCGSAVRPVTDAFARGICADVPGSRLAAGLALAAGAVLVAVAVPFVWDGPGAGEQPA